MDDIILKVDNLSKQYQLGQFGTGTIGRDVDRWWHRIRGKEDPYLKIGETNDRTSKGSSDFVWAIRDINFEVKRGEVLGIIGKNGAGKSTLLKLLSRITSPTTGSIKSRGRMASLLEVGTGFHPELSGLENIFLNGAILGMTKAEIKQKLDNIIDFSGCVRYIDTPTKRYSSGMNVRLGFAVAAFLDPEILVVDEVLAVGDAEFQKQAIGKMQDVSRNEGRTVLFVSHNMESIRRLCTKGLLLTNGVIKNKGPVNDIVNDYINLNTNKSASYMSIEDNPIRIQEIKLLNEGQIEQYTFNHDDDIYIRFELSISEFKAGMALFVMVLDKFSNRVFPTQIGLIKGKKVYTLRINDNFLVRGNYSLECFIHIPKVRQFDTLTSVCHFKVMDNYSALLIHGDYNYGNVFGNCSWDIS